MTSTPGTDDGRPNPWDMLRMHGSDFVEPYAFTDDDDNPLNITGWSGLEGEMRLLGSTTLAASFAFARTDDEGGTGMLSIPGFSALAVGSYTYFVRYRDSLGNRSYAGRGLIRISKENP